MSIMNLMGIYHSFLLKKWYVLLYVLALIGLILAALLWFNAHQQKETILQLGIVDQDQTTETNMILQAVGKGEEFSNQFKLKPFTNEQATKALENHKIDGYIVLKEGMTKAFYKNGELPIHVYTYDETSVQSIVIQQLADSVYSRLMLAESGILTFAEFQKKATDEEFVSMMIRLLVTGLDRQGAFEVEEVKTYQLSTYVLVSAYFLSILIIYWTVSTLLHMNTSQALQQRLRLYPFVQERLILSRGLFATTVTVLFSIIMTICIVPFTAFEAYNSLYLITTLLSYILSIFFLFTLCEWVRFSIGKWLILLYLLVFSGAVIPTLYTQQWHMKENLFAQVFQRILDLLHENYITDFTFVFYIQISSIVLIWCVVLVWRKYR
ncbi:ABC transporter permease [Kurthia sp. ISK08]|uniref:ABC transporter permease n=1 Tax=Kurthia sp. ISK08 TaxID=3385835 RepID=UPI0038FC0607